MTMMDKLRASEPARADALALCKTRDEVKRYLTRRRCAPKAEYPTDAEIWAWRELLVLLPHKRKWT